MGPVPRMVSLTSAPCGGSPEIEQGEPLASIGWYVGDGDRPAVHGRLGQFAGQSQVEVDVRSSSRGCHAQSDNLDVDLLLVLHDGERRRWQIDTRGRCGDHRSLLLEVIPGREG